MRVLTAAICLALAMPASAFRPTLTAGGATAAPGGGGGGGGAFTFVASASGSDDASDTDVSTSSTLNIQAGDVIIAAVQWEDNGSATVSSFTDGTNALTFDTGDDVHSASNEINLFPYYKLVASENATAMFTATISTSVPFKKMVVLQFRPGGCPSSCETVTKDISGARENNGTGSSTVSTGTFSTTGSDVVACGLGGMYTSGTWVSPVVAGSAATGVEDPSGIIGWCRIVTSPLSTQTASVSYTFSNTWAATAIAFKSE